MIATIANTMSPAIGPPAIKKILVTKTPSGAGP